MPEPSQKEVITTQNGHPVLAKFIDMERNRSQLHSQEVNLEPSNKKTIRHTNLPIEPLGVDEAGEGDEEEREGGEQPHLVVDVAIPVVEWGGHGGTRRLLYRHCTPVNSFANCGLFPP